MLVRYFWINKNSFGNKIVQEINLGGNFNFAFKGNVLTAKPNSTYIDHLYEKYPKISDVSILVGENGAGKTEAMRSINDILRGVHSGYVFIVQSDKNYKIYTDRNITLNIDVRDGYTFDVVRLSESDSSVLSQKLHFVYISSVYDRTHIMDEAEGWADLSTNRKVQEMWKDVRSWAEFRSDIIFERLSFLSQLNGNTQRKTLFEFPKVLQVIFQVNEKNYKKWIDFTFETAETESKEKIETLYNRFLADEDETLPTQESHSFNERFLWQFRFYHIFQILMECIDKKIVETNGVIDDLLQSMKTESNSMFLKYSVVNAFSKINRQDETKNPTLNPNITMHTDNRISLLENTVFLLRKILDFIEEFNDASKSLDETYYWDSLDGIDGDEAQDAEYLTDTESQVRKMIELSKKATDKIAHLYSYQVEQIDECILNIETEYYYDLDSAIEDLASAIKELRDDIQRDITQKEDEAAQIQQTATETDYEYRERETFIEELQEKETNLSKQTSFLQSAISERAMTEENILYLDITKNETIEFLNTYNNSRNIFEARLSHEELSSGQNAYFDILFRLFLFVEKRNKEIAQEESISTASNTKRYTPKNSIRDNVVLLIDEGEVYLHPQYQKLYVDNFLSIVSEIMPETSIQVIFTTNSPLILTDVQHSNVMYLTSDRGEVKPTSKTFGANISNLMIHNFFIQDGLVGQFAKKHIEEQIIEKLKQPDLSPAELDAIERQIAIIGEPLVASKLASMLEAKRYQTQYKIMNSDDLDTQIKLLQTKIDLLKQRKEQIDNDNA